MFFHTEKTARWQNGHGATDESGNSVGTNMSEALTRLVHEALTEAAEAGATNLQLSHNSDSKSMLSVVVIGTVDRYEIVNTRELKTRRQWPPR